MDTVKGERILCLSTRYVGCVGLPTGPGNRKKDCASAHATWVASLLGIRESCMCGALPQHTLRGLRPERPGGRCKHQPDLCLSTRYVGCVGKNILRYFVECAVSW